ncbi:MAG: ABC transporter substrate-binding protein [Acidimicrobiia bacterium]|nr:ABC transporter substrate-binding protein [Acidimicrobiia bacterium]
MSRTIKLGAFYRSLPMLVAEEKGFYADRDIEIDYGQVKSSTQQFDFLSDGRYEVVQTSPDNTANYRLNDDNPIGKRVDAQGFMGLDYGMKLIVVARSGIETIEDLRGKTVSVDARASGFAYVLYKILAQHGLEPDEDYEVVSHGGVYDRYMALVEHDEDFHATLMSGGFETRAENRGFNLLDSVRDIADPYLGVWAAARTDWLQSNRDLVIDMIDGYRRATDWVFDPANKEECLDLLLESQNTTRALAEQLYAIQLQPGVGNVPDASIDPEAVRNVLALRVEFEGFETPQDLDELIGPDTDLFDLSYWREADARQ